MTRAEHKKMIKLSFKFRGIFNSNMNKCLRELNFNIPLEAFAYNLVKTKKVYSSKLFLCEKNGHFSGSM